MKPINVRVHIEELVLHGFPPGDRHLIAAAVQRELTGLFEKQTFSPSMLQSADIARLDGGAFNIAPRGETPRVGSQIAQALYGGLNR